ncbi:MAG: hypothetical protein G8237_05295 [Magnetococcales bacterium]|nr:hypothetical protein [Magnetococcales bacterium]NGZ05753.1 hypothetical protein [Magnetococcales bacterium]
MHASESLQKAEMVRILLETEGRVMLCLDATVRGVEVPRRFGKDNGLRLILNRNMPQPIEIGVTAIESELRFGGIPHYCVIPYEALWGVFNPDTRHGMFWGDSMPEEIRARHSVEESTLRLPEAFVQSAEPAPVVPVPAPAPAPAKVALRVIDGGDGGNVPTESSKRSRPNLRVVS